MSHAHAVRSSFRVKPADAPFLRGGDYSEPGQFDFIMAQELYFCNKQMSGKQKAPVNVTGASGF